MSAHIYELEAYGCANIVASYLHNANDKAPIAHPPWIELIQYSILVLAGPGSAWHTANSSWYCDPSVILRA